MFQNMLREREKQHPIKYTTLSYHDCVPVIQNTSHTACTDVLVQGIWGLRVFAESDFMSQSHSQTFTICFSWCVCCGGEGGGVTL